MDPWFDDEFFQTGAFLRLRSGKYLFGKGGTSTTAPELPEVLVPNHFYLKNFYDESIRIYAPREHVLRESLPQFSVPGGRDIELIATADASYEEDFRSLKVALGEGLKKVVLISRSTYSTEDSHETKKNAFLRALSSDAGIPYGLWDSRSGILGVTPEVLFDLREDKLSTYALAGTAPAQEKDSLLRSEKDLREHSFVVQNISEVLREYSSEVKASALKTQGFRNLVHLRTDIEAEVRSQQHLPKILSSLSPTAALGGYPKKRALNFLRSTKYAEAHPGRIYGSALGVQSTEGDVRFVVMIRNLQWKADEIFIECGGGIVAESEFENELQEIRLKRRTCEDLFLKDHP